MVLSPDVIEMPVATNYRTGLRPLKAQPSRSTRDFPAEAEDIMSVMTSIRLHRPLSMLMGFLQNPPS